MLPSQLQKQGKTCWNGLKLVYYRSRNNRCRTSPCPDPKQPSRDRSKPFEHRPLSTKPFEHRPIIYEAVRAPFHRLRSRSNIVRLNFPPFSKESSLQISLFLLQPIRGKQAGSKLPAENKLPGQPKLPETMCSSTKKPKSSEIKPLQWKTILAVNSASRAEANRGIPNQIWQNYCQKIAWLVGHSEEEKGPQHTSKMATEK